MFFDEQQVRHDDVGLGHRSLGAGKRGGVFGPFGGGVDRNLDPGKILGQTRRDAGGGAGGMGIQRQDHEAVVTLARFGRQAASSA